ncbi:MAG: FkbM family methyltransferase [Candidatus Paceibacterota bacterium]|jgi:FkbM family methyltransferase
MSTKTHLKQVNGIWLPETDTHFSNAILKNPIIAGKGAYQYHKIMRALDLLKPSDMRDGIAIDVGAHVGLWTRILELYFGQVCAFEPEPVAHVCLKRNVTLNTTKCFNIAVSDVVGELTLDVITDNSGNTRVDKDGSLESFCTTLDYHLQSFWTTLDYHNADNVRFIKIDVEGYELFVLRGAIETIKKYKPLIVVEQKPGNAERYGLKTTEACTFLESLGMKQLWRISGDYCYGW